VSASPEFIAQTLARAERVRGAFPSLGRAASVELVLALQEAEPEWVVAERIRGVNESVGSGAPSFQDLYNLCRNAIPLPNADLRDAVMAAAGWL